MLIGSDDEFAATGLVPVDRARRRADVDRPQARPGRGLPDRRGGATATCRASPVEVLCGIGAGDALTAAFAAGLLRGIPALEAVERGNVAGAIVASRLMCSTAMPTPAEIDALLVRSATRMIHPAKLPMTRDVASLHVHPDAAGAVATDPERSGWRYLSFRAFGLGEGESVTLEHPEQEAAIVDDLGWRRRARVRPGVRASRLPGRPSVFEGMPWSAYVPAGTVTRVVGRPLPGRRAVVAVAQAPPSGRTGVATEPILVGPDDVEIEIRGAGNATRQVNNIMMPDFPADRLLICEVFTPNGNWSGWPPHKHDVDDPPREAVLEETYYYQISRPEGWGIQRVYHRDGSRDLVLPVRHGDLLSVDQGYHPFASTQGYDAYYLNALAGDRRTMANTDDPDLAWVRTLWPSMAPDPRLPLVHP